MKCNNLLSVALPFDFDKLFLCYKKGTRKPEDIVKCQTYFNLNYYYPNDSECTNNFHPQMVGGDGKFCSDQLVMSSVKIVLVK